ncbi:MAG TPA: HPP family protein [Ferruginibacter sp.]|nr:HPP family protein [Ferruginibacter sp.]HMP21158.1 HPP family protein [Ferruginibacter sp.]
MKKKIKRSYRLAKYIVYKQTLVKPADHFWTFIGAFMGIGIIGFIQKHQFAQTDNVYLIGSFGATAVLIFGSTNSPLAQPRNVLLGHLISAFIGVTCNKLFPNEIWLSSALAVSVSIVCMQITKSMHPPGGATAIIANIGTEKIKNLGYYYVLSPVLSGVLILLLTALIINNLPANRNYPSKK